VNQIAQAQFLIERSVNEMHLLLSGDYAKVTELATSVGVSKELVHQILHHFNSELGFAQEFEHLSTLLRDETLPAVAEAMRLLAADNPQIESEFESTSRQLAALFEESGENIFGDNFDDASSSSSPSSFSSSSSSAFGEEGDYHSFPNTENIQSFIDDPKKLDNLIRKMAGQGGVNLSNLMKQTGGKMRHGGHHHRKHTTSMVRPNKKKSFRRLKQNIRRLQQAPDTCNAGCDDIANEIQRKICNCRELIICAGNLKNNDAAVMFSRGLVDAESGTIEVEKVDYSNFQSGSQPLRK
jgi:predicted transcriptional regulator